MYIAGTRGYDSGWVYFNKNDALLIAQNFDNLLTTYKNTEELNQFMSELTGIPDVVQTRKTIMDLHNKLFKMDIDLSQQREIYKASLTGVQMATPRTNIGGGYINTQRKVKGSKGNRTLKRIKKKQKKKNKNKNKKKKS